MKTEGRDVNPDQVRPHVVHPALHQDYDLDFRMQRVYDIAPTLTSPMLSGLVSSVCSIWRPEVPKESVPLKMEEGLRDRSRVLTGPDVPGPSCIGESTSQVHAAEVEADVSRLYEEGVVDPDQTIPGITLEDAAAITISDDDEVNFLSDMPQRVSTPKDEPASKPK